MCAWYVLFVCIFPASCSTSVIEHSKLESSKVWELHFLGNANDSRLLYFTFKSHYDSVVSTSATLSPVSTSTHTIAASPSPSPSPRPESAYFAKLLD